MKARQLLACVAMALGIAACQARPVPLAARAGTSITILLQSTDNPLRSVPTQPLSARAAYGGSVVPDLQRGTMIFTFDTCDPAQNTCELETQGASAVLPAPSSKAAADGALGAAPGQVVVLLHIPPDAPVGPNTMSITKRLGGVDSPGPGYWGDIEVLPPALDPGTGDPIDNPTPFERLLGCSVSVCDASDDIPKVTPRPEVQIGMTPAPSSVELRVTYPASVINVRDAFQTVGQQVPLNDRGLVWYLDDGGGTLTIHAAATTPGAVLDTISFVFELENGVTTPLLANQVVPTVVKAADANGIPMSPPTLTLTKGIW